MGSNPLPMFIYQLNVSVYGEQYGYNDNYPTKEIDKYECQTGPFEGFFYNYT